MARNYVRVSTGVDDKISGPLDKIRDKFDKLQKQGAKGFAIGVGAAVTTTALNALSGALSGVVDQVFQAVDAASNQREAMALNEQVFKGAAKAIDDWSDTTAKAFGESKTNAINYAATFGNTMKAAGLSADELAEKSMELTRRAADIGSAFNASGEEVATALRSGLVGEAEPLRRLGILLNAAEVENRALAMGLAKTKKEITEADKVLARYNIIMEQSAESAGMFGRDTESLADAQKSLEAALADVAADIGTKLLPAMVKLANFAKDEIVPAISGMVDALDDAGDAFNILGEIVNAVTSQGTSGVGAYARHVERDAKAAADAVEESAERNKVSLQQLGDAMRGQGTVMGRVLDTTGDGFDDLADGAEDMKKSVLRSWRDMVKGIADEATELIADFFDPIETRADLYQQRLEQNAAEERLRDAKTAREKREATADILGSIRDQLDGLKDLSEHGALTSKDIDTVEKNIKQSFSALGTKVPAEIQKMIDKLRELDKWDGHKISVNVRGNFGGGVNTFRPMASGGRAKADEVLKVGERGEEWFVPDQDGEIIPNDVVRSAATMPSGSPITVYLTVKADVLTPGSARALADQLGPVLTSWQQRNGLLPRTSTPL